MSTTATETKDGKKYTVILPNVRLSYPNLFVAKKIKKKDGTFDEGDAKYGATFIMEKATQKDLINMIKTKMVAMLTEFNKGERLAPDKYCLRGGEFKPGKAGYGEGVEFITSSNTRPPVVVDSKLVGGKFVPLEATDKRLFAGCYVNATVRLWFQDNANGKRINGSLEGVQYLRPGEPFGEEQSSAEEMFGELPHETEDAPAPGDPVL